MSLPQGHPQAHKKRVHAYWFASAHRAAQAMKKGHYRNNDLNSTSMDQPTMNHFVQSQTSTTQDDGKAPVPLKTYQPPSSSRQRPHRLGSLGSFGSLVISSMTRSQVRSTVVAIPEPGSSQEKAADAETTWTVDLEKGKQTHDMIRCAMEDSVVTSRPNADSGSSKLEKR